MTTEKVTRDLMSSLVPLATPRYYYANSSGQSVGPLGRSELQTFIQAGAIQAETPIMIDGDAKWSTARQLSLSTTVVPDRRPPTPPKMEAAAGVFSVENQLKVEWLPDQFMA